MIQGILIPSMRIPIKEAPCPCCQPKRPCSLCGEPISIGKWPSSVGSILSNHKRSRRYWRQRSYKPFRDQGLAPAGGMLVILSQLHIPLTADPRSSTRRADWAPYVWTRFVRHVRWASRTEIRSPWPGFGRHPDRAREAGW